MNYEEFKRQFPFSCNTQQEKAVQAVEGPVLLLAVPGSGKTTVLVNRLGYMIYCLGIPPQSILTVTYTVAATNDMRNRFRSRFGHEYADQLEFRTINGISQKILQYFAGITGKTVFKVADREAVSIIKNVFLEITEKYPTENDIKELQLAITYAKNMGLTADEIEKMDQFPENFPEVFPEIFRAYNQRLRKLQMIDYDDQMIYALKILEQYPQVLFFFQQKYPYICVDEAQDTSKIQHQMMDLLAGQSHNLFMVGDEDQSIYGFRAAYPKALMDFEKRHPGARVLYMETNYRSKSEIVRAADAFIQHNTQRHPKHLVAARDGGGCVTRIPASSRRGQFQYLLKVASDCSKETAVLYRNNESALPLLDLLERNRIPFRVKRTDMTFFSHPVVNDIRDFIYFSFHPQDRDVFLRIYYKMGAGISKKIAMDAVAVNSGNSSLLQLVQTMDEVPLYVVKQCRALSTHFANLQGEPAGKAIYRILHYMGYEAYMAEHGMDRGKAEILRLLGEQVEKVSEFPDRLDRLQHMMEEGYGDPEAPFILSTIHSSKGLEYERVYLADIMTGIFPSVSLPTVGKPTGEELSAYEEERRLFYVGMTRAREELFVFAFEKAEASAFTGELFGQEKRKTQGPEASGKNGKGSVGSRYGVQGTFENPYREKGTALSKQKAGVGAEALHTSLQQCHVGTLLTHKKYGQGQVRSIEGDIAEIYFAQAGTTKKISLPVALSKKMVTL